MDIDLQKLQFLGFFGVCKESFRIVLSSWKINSIIFLNSSPFLAGLCGTLLALSNLILSIFVHLKSSRNSINFSATIFFHLKKQWYDFLVCLFYVAFFSLIAISFVVYSVACVYAGKADVLSKTEIGKVYLPISKKVIPTLLRSFAIFLGYNQTAAVVGFSWVFFSGFSKPSSLAISAGFWIIYMMGFLYISSIFLLATLVSILEDARGFEAIVKSRQLVKGKMALAFLIFPCIILSTFTIAILSCTYTFHVLKIGWLYSVVTIILRGVCLPMVILFVLVAETITYFVSKSCDPRTMIDKSVLEDHLMSFFPKPDDPDAEKATRKYIYCILLLYAFFVSFVVIKSLTVVIK